MDYSEEFQTNPTLIDYLIGTCSTIASLPFWIGQGAIDLWTKIRGGEIEQLERRACDLWDSSDRKDNQTINLQLIPIFDRLSVHYTDNNNSSLAREYRHRLALVRNSL